MARKTTYYTNETSCFDEDVKTFILAAGITNPVEISALCTLVAAKRANGSWDKEDIIYPYSPTSLEAARYNLKDPAKFRLTYVNDVSSAHSELGMQGDGVWHARTGYVPSTEGLGNFIRWHYATNGLLQQTFGVDWGAGTKGQGFWFRGAKFDTNPVEAEYGMGTNLVVQVGAINGIASYQRWFAFQSIPEKHFFDGVLIVDAADIENVEKDLELLMFAFNNAGSFQNESFARATYWSLGENVGDFSDSDAIEALHLDEFNIIKAYNDTVIIGGR